MEYRYSSQGGQALITLAGRIEGQDVARLQEPFEKIAAAGHKKVDLDFAGVSFVGSAGIATLLQMQKAVAGRGGQVCIINSPASIASLLRSLKLDGVFNII